MVSSSFVGYPTDVRTLLLCFPSQRRALQARRSVARGRRPDKTIYFPRTGMISLLAVMQAGNGVETATVGREGAVGIMAGLGGHTAVGRAVVQVAGISSQITVSRFLEAANASAGIRELIGRYYRYADDSGSSIGRLQCTSSCHSSPVPMASVNAGPRRTPKMCLRLESPGCMSR